ncbi:MAG: 50S ribosomal protein L33 [Phycisphaerales bacterium]|nr:50S ribosomal protein L33 [Phycisphaerales bacterium]MCB9857310.1 50S ribosomal protein L33 [Phycisphaerales bacterium]MCB9862976.1 50S ribosomal protein L33 [Phycisphaerales bacterium]
MAKASKREHVWLQCKECDGLNYRTNVNTKAGIPEGLKEGLKKFCKTERRHTMHKIKRK